MTRKPLFSSTPTITNPWQKLGVLVGVIFIGACVGHWVVGWLPWSRAIIAQQLPAPTQPYRKFLLVTQAAIASSAFIGAPLWYWRFIEQKQVSCLFQWKQRYPYPMLLTVGLVGSFMMVNTLCIQWNMALKLPALLAGFEQWAQHKEAELKRLTALLTTFHSTTDFLGGLLVMGLLPALGEELLFRGLLQSLLRAITKNMHLAIYLSAFIFGAIHLQFYGFVPRVLLGMLFGYVYAWTKDLAFPIVAHFFNNAFTLLMLFLHQQGLVEQDVSATQALPVPVIALCTGISIALAGTLRRHSKSVHAHSIP